MPWLKTQEDIVITFGMVTAKEHRTCLSFPDKVTCLDSDILVCSKLNDRVPCLSAGISRNTSTFNTHNPSESVNNKIIWPLSSEKGSSSMYSDQPAYPLSYYTTFSVWMKKRLVKGHTYSAQRRLVILRDAQTDLGFRCPHMPEDTFSLGTADFVRC